MPSLFGCSCQLGEAESDFQTLCGVYVIKQMATDVGFMYGTMANVT